MLIQLFNECLGIFATILLILSMTFNCKSVKAQLLMRAFNGLASILFVIYSIKFLAYSTMISNTIILVLDVYYFINIIKTTRSNS